MKWENNSDIMKDIINIFYEQVYRKYNSGLFIFLSNVCTCLTMQGHRGTGERLQCSVVASNWI